MKNNIFNILKKEIREMFRDKKSLSMMLIIPVMIPVLVIGMSTLFEMQMDKSSNIEDYNKIGFAYELSETETEIAKNLGIIAISNDLESLQESYKMGNINLYITKDNNTYIINGNDNESTALASTLAESYFSKYKE